VSRWPEPSAHPLALDRIVFHQQDAGGWCDGTVTQASGTAERRASEAMLKKKTKRSGRRITVGEDKAYDTSDHVAALREMNITPHVAQNDSLTKTGKHRSSAVDGRTTRHIGYRISQSCRAMSECIFGWGKQHGTMRKTKHRGIAVVGAVSCSISSPTISCASPSSSPLEAGVRPKTPNRTQSRGKSNKTTRTASIFNVFQQTARFPPAGPFR
jgi:hypothetical protein